MLCEIERRGRNIVKNLPEVDISFRDLHRMYIASIRSKLMLTGIELKVFNQLSKPKSAEAVAQAIGTNPRNTELFLNSLVAIDLLKKKDGLYRNSPIAQTFLMEKSPTYLGQLFAIMTSWDSPVFENLSKLVREGPPPKPETSTFSEEMVEQYAAMYASTELAEVQEVLNIV